TSAARRLSVAIWRVMRRVRPGSSLPCLSAVARMPVPSGLVSSTRSPGRASALVSSWRRLATPVTTQSRVIPRSYAPSPAVAVQESSIGVGVPGCSITPIPAPGSCTAMHPKPDRRATLLGAMEPWWCQPLRPALGAEEDAMGFKFPRAAFISLPMCCWFLSSGILHAASFPEFVDPHPDGGNQFGATIVPLSTGNVVITSPLDDAGGPDAGAVY